MSLWETLTAKTKITKKTDAKNKVQTIENNEHHLIQFRSKHSHRFPIKIHPRPM